MVPGARRADGTSVALAGELRERRRRLLDLHYTGKLSADLFAEQEAALTAQLGALEAELSEQRQRLQERNDIAQAFEDVARHLADLDIEDIWQKATERERWIIASDLLDEIAIYPDHLEVRVSGAPRMNVTLQEVGLTGGSSFQRVGEPTRTSTPLRYRVRLAWSPGATRPCDFYRSSTEPLTNSRYRPPQDETPIAREPCETTPCGTWRHKQTWLARN